MTTTGATAGNDDPGSGRELWLAMRAAHNRYKNASAALDALTAASLDSVASEWNLHIGAAAEVQRNAFEDYIEARLELSECLLSKKNSEPMFPEAAGQRSGSGTRFSGRVVLAVAAVCLFQAAFGLGYLAHERRQGSGLEAARDETNPTLNQTRKQVQALARQVAALEATNQDGAQARSVSAAATPKRTTARSHQKLARLKKRGERHYREFTAMPRRHPERIGPIRS